MTPALQPLPHFHFRFTSVPTLRARRCANNDEGFVSVIWILEGNWALLHSNERELF
jgi:hypothetical protein